MNRKVVIALMWVGGLGAAIGLSFFGDDEAPEESPAAAGTLERGEAATREPEAGDEGNEVADDGHSAESRNVAQFRGGPAHLGRSTLEGPNAGELAWRFETDGRITAQPVVGPGGTIYVGSHDEVFYAISPSGRERWQRDLGGRIYSTAAVDSRGNVYVGSDGGALWSFSEDGDLRWKVDFPEDVDTAITLTELNGEDALVFCAGPVVVAMNLEGEDLWRYDVGIKVFAAPAVDSRGNVYVGSQDDYFYSLNSAGELRWRYRTEGDNDAAPVLTSDGLYFGSDDNRVYALDLDGELRWSAHLDGMVRAPLSVGLDGALLVGVFGPRPRVLSLSPDDGEERWAFAVTLSDTTEFGVASGVLVDSAGNLYFGAHDDYFYSLTPDGELRWVFQTGGDVDSSATLSERHLLFGADDKHLYAIQR